MVPGPDQRSIVSHRWLFPPLSAHWVAFAPFAVSHPGISSTFALLPLVISQPSVGLFRLYDQL